MGAGNDAGTTGNNSGSAKARTEYENAMSEVRRLERELEDAEKRFRQTGQELEIPKEMEADIKAEAEEKLAKSIQEMENGIGAHKKAKSKVADRKKDWEQRRQMAANVKARECVRIAQWAMKKKFWFGVDKEKWESLPEEEKWINGYPEGEKRLEEMSAEEINAEMAKQIEAAYKIKPENQPELLEEKLQLIVDREAYFDPTMPISAQDALENYEKCKDSRSFNSVLTKAGKEDALKECYAAIQEKREKKKRYIQKIQGFGLAVTAKQMISIGQSDEEAKKYIDEMNERLESNEKILDTAWDDLISSKAVYDAALQEARETGKEAFGILNERERGLARWEAKIEKRKRGGLYTLPDTFTEILKIKDKEKKAEVDAVINTLLTDADAGSVENYYKALEAQENIKNAVDTYQQLDTEKLKKALFAEKKFGSDEKSRKAEDALEKAFDDYERAEQKAADCRNDLKNMGRLSELPKDTKELLALNPMQRAVAAVDMNKLFEENNIPDGFPKNMEEYVELAKEIDRLSKEQKRLSKLREKTAEAAREYDNVTEKLKADLMAEQRIAGWISVYNTKQPESDVEKIEAFQNALKEREKAVEELSVSAAEKNLVIKHFIKNKMKEAKTAEKKDIEEQEKGIKIERNSIEGSRKQIINEKLYMARADAARAKYIENMKALDEKFEKAGKRGLTEHIKEQGEIADNDYKTDVKKLKEQIKTRRKEIDQIINDERKAKEARTADKKLRKSMANYREQRLDNAKSDIRMASVKHFVMKKADWILDGVCEKCEDLLEAARNAEVSGVLQGKKEKAEKLQIKSDMQERVIVELTDQYNAHKSEAEGKDAFRLGEEIKKSNQGIQEELGKLKEETKSLKEEQTEKRKSTIERKNPEKKSKDADAVSEVNEIMDAALREAAGADDHLKLEADVSRDISEEDIEALVKGDKEAEAEYQKSMGFIRNWTENLSPLFNEKNDFKISLAVRVVEKACNIVIGEINELKVLPGQEEIPKVDIMGALSSYAGIGGEEGKETDPKFMNLCVLALEKGVNSLNEYAGMLQEKEKEASVNLSVCDIFYQALQEDEAGFQKYFASEKCKESEEYKARMEYYRSQLDARNAQLTSQERLYGDAEKIIDDKISAIEADFDAEREALEQKLREERMEMLESARKKEQEEFENAQKKRENDLKEAKESAAMIFANAVKDGEDAINKPVKLEPDALAADLGGNRENCYAFLKSITGVELNDHTELEVVRNTIGRIYINGKSVVEAHGLEAEYQRAASSMAEEDKEAFMQSVCSMVTEIHAAVRAPLIVNEGAPASGAGTVISVENEHLGLSAVTIQTANITDERLKTQVKEANKCFKEENGKYNDSRRDAVRKEKKKQEGELRKTKEKKKVNEMPDMHEKSTHNLSLASGI